MKMKKTLPILFFLVFANTLIFAQKSVNVPITELTTQTFKQKVWNYDQNKSFKRVGNLPIILDFYATWCRPCKMLAPHLQTIQNKFKGKLIVYRIDVDQQPELAQRFNVQAMPTIVFIPNATSYKSELGYREYDELEKMVKGYFFRK
jgi:thioredoxin